MGVEPTWTGLQPVAWPSGSSVNESPAQADGRQLSFLSKSSDLGLHHQKRPFFRQHFLNRLPLPHGQRSLRPSFSSRSLSPCTMRTPRPTCVSDGKPFRRLLIVSKKTAVRQNCVWTWDTSIHNSVQKKRQKCPRQELNLVLDLRRVACDPAHSKDNVVSVPRQGVEPRLAVPKTAVRPSHSQGIVSQ